MSNTRRAKTALIVGEATGLAREIALRFAMEGDAPVLLDARGADPEELRAAFVQRGLPIPTAVRDFSELAPGTEPIDALTLVADPSAPLAGDDRASLHEAVERHCWPLVDGMRRIKELRGVYPRYAILVWPLRDSQSGMAAAAEAVNQVFVRYLNYHLFSEGIAFNMLLVDSRSPEASHEAAAKTVFALTSGMMDALRGQIITLNGGRTLRYQQLRTTL